MVSSTTPSTGVGPAGEPAPLRPRGRPQGSVYERVEGRLTRAQIVALEAAAARQGITRAEALRRAVDAYVGLVPVRGIVPEPRKLRKGR